MKNEKSFGELWPSIRSFFRGIDFLVAHNASFDRSVLEACCDRYDIEIPNKNFLCTVDLSRRIWNIYPTRLPDVSDYLGLSS